MFLLRGGIGLSTGAYGISDGLVSFDGGPAEEFNLRGACNCFACCTLPGSISPTTDGVNETSLLRTEPAFFFGIEGFVFSGHAYLYLLIASAVVHAGCITPVDRTSSGGEFDTINPEVSGLINDLYQADRPGAPLPSLPKMIKRRSLKNKHERQRGRRTEQRIGSTLAGHVDAKRKPANAGGIVAAESPTTREAIVSTMSGQEWKLEFDVKVSVYKAKSIVAKATGFPAKEFQLICGTRLLPEGEQLFEAIDETFSLCCCEVPKAVARISLVCNIDASSSDGCPPLVLSSESEVVSFCRQDDYDETSSDEDDAADVKHHFNQIRKVLQYESESIVLCR